MRPSRVLHVLLALAIAVPAALPAQTPTFAPLEPLPAGIFLYGNFNGNGDTDLIVSLGDTSYDFYTGDGAGNFALTPAGGPGGTLTLPQVITGQLIADVNGDGKDDVVILDNGCKMFNCSDPGSLSVLLSQGNGVFTSGSTTALPAGYSNLEGIVGDFNKDGKPDLAVLASDTSFAGPAAQLLIFLNNGSGGFTQTAYQLAPSDFTEFSPTNLVTGDFEGNGNQDLAFATDYQGSSAYKIWTFAGNGKGGFGPAVASYTLDSFINPGDLAFFNALTLFAADLNGDGRTDLLLSIASKTDFGANSRVPSLLAEVSGKFSWHSAVYITGTDLVALGDLNGDGKPDLVFVDWSSRGPTVPAGIYLGLGNGAFHTPHIPLSLTNISPDGCRSVTALPLKTGALPSLLFPCAGLFVNTTKK